MRFMVPTLVAVLALPVAPGIATARTLASDPISHAAGFQSVNCHFVNTGDKDLTVSRFFIEDVNSSTSFGSGASGSCGGLPPWTVPPKRGCSRALISVAACNQPNACFCFVEFSGSPKHLRGALVGTVNGSTIHLTSELR